MDLEVINCEHDIAVECHLPLDENHVILGSYPWLEWLKRRAKNPDLFVYRHAQSGRFMLCHWLFKPSETSQPVAQELEGFFDTPQSTWPADLMAPSVLLQRLRPAAEIAEDRMRHRKAAADAQRAARTERLEVRTKAATRLHKAGLHTCGRQMSEGHYPVAPLTGNDESTTYSFLKE